MLFVSEKAILDGTKAIRGGIPLVFPKFGPWELGPQHGFARISQWKVAEEPKEENGETSAVFVLEDSENTRKMWSYRFKLLYEVTVGKHNLKMTITAENKDEKPFEFTTLLHTYFRVPDVTKTTVSGLTGLTYVDKVHVHWFIFARHPKLLAYSFVIFRDWLNFIQEKKDNVIM